jgi:endoglucanase
VLAVLLAVDLLASCGRLPSERAQEPQQAAEITARTSAEAFFDRYVDQTGRVVRHDQGSDTVSEGQAYAMLLAVALEDQARFRVVWKWTKDKLQRDDRLFSWHWDSGVTDEEPAADADLDIARALVLAGHRFDHPAWTTQAVAVGRAILRHETASVAGKRILLPNPSADQAPPLMFNASYVSPVATQQLFEASGDHRWKSVESGSRALMKTLTDDQLPPDWVVLQADGSVRTSTQFGFDAVRVPIRHAESCVVEDRHIAASMVSRLEADRSDVATTPVGWVARSASYAAADRPEKSGTALAKADEARRVKQSYYGDAWDALGRYMLLDRRLGGCPPEEVIG